MVIYGLRQWWLAPGTGVEFSDDMLQMLTLSSYPPFNQHHSSKVDTRRNLLAPLRANFGDILISNFAPKLSLRHLSAAVDHIGRTSDPKFLRTVEISTAVEDLQVTK